MRCMRRVSEKACMARVGARSMRRCRATPPKGRRNAATEGRGGARGGVCKEERPEIRGAEAARTCDGGRGSERGEMRGASKRGDVVASCFTRGVRVELWDSEELGWTGRGWGASVLKH